MTDVGGSVVGSSVDAGCGEGNNGWPKWLEVAKKYDQMLQIREKALEIESEYQRQKKLQEEGLQYNFIIRIDEKLEKKYEKARKFLQELFPKFERKVVEYFYKLLERAPEAAKKFSELVSEIAKDYGYAPLIADVSTTLKYRYYAYANHCKSKFVQGKKPACGEICEKARITYSRGEPIIVYDAPITILRHVDKATGKTLKTEIRQGHQYIDLAEDPFVTTEIIRTHEKRVIKGKIAEAAAKLGYYCPYMLAAARSLPAETAPTAPEPAPDHFPEDITATVNENGEFSKVWLSKKHGSEEEVVA